ncbi:MAG: T9SS type A sorting domain-containing protein, partial [Bacteroidota bacterium]
LSGQNLLKNIGADSLLGTTDLGNSSPTAFTALNDNQFVFQGFVSPLETGNLHVSDGTEVGTQKLGDVQAEGQMIRFRDRVYFAGTGFQDGRALLGLWATDGTVEGTEVVFESSVTTDSVPLEPANFFVLDTFLIFSGLTATHGTELWRTDGTAAGTELIMDISPGIGSGFRGREPAVIDSIFYFTASTPDTGEEPWRTDGTEAGTWRIADLSPGPVNSGAADYTGSGGYIYFSALVPGSGREVRRMTAAQGSPVELIGENGGSTDSSNPRYFVDADGTLFWVAKSAGSDGFELRSYDHVGEPTVIEPTEIFPQILKPFGDGQVVFKGRDSGGRELWISDGTTVGTRRITDLYPGEGDGVFTNVSAESFHVYQDSLVFYAGSDGVAADGEFVYELFVTDGTEEGTRLIADQAPGTAGTNPGNFFTFKDRVYFAASDPVVGREPFYLGPEDLLVSLREPAPKGLQLIAKPYPNPLRAGERFQLELSLEQRTKLIAGLYDIRGALVQEFPLPANGLRAGTHTIPLTLPDGAASGTYLLRLANATGAITLKLMVRE